MGHTWPNPSLECSSPSVHPDDAVPCQWCEFYDLHSHGVERSPAAGHAQGQWLRFALLASPLWVCPKVSMSWHLVTFMSWGGVMPWRPQCFYKSPKNWCFWTVLLEKTLEVPWTARRSNQSILKEISPGISLEGTMLKLKLQYFGNLLWRVDSFEKTLMLGGIGDRRRSVRQKMRWLDGITDLLDVSLSELR